MNSQSEKGHVSSERKLTCHIEIEGQGFVMLIAVPCKVVKPGKNVQGLRLVKSGVAA